MFPEKKQSLDHRFLSIVNRYTCLYPSFHSLKVVFVFFLIRNENSPKYLIDVVLDHSPCRSNHWAFIWSRDRSAFHTMLGQLLPRITVGVTPYMVWIWLCECRKWTKKKNKTKTFEPLTLTNIKAFLMISKQIFC